MDFPDGKNDINDKSNIHCDSQKIIDAIRIYQQNGNRLQSKFTHLM